MATRKSKTKRYYFTEKHEEAIVKYAKTNDIKVRTELYVVFIQPAFSELVDKIVFTYKFSNLPNIDLLRDECKIWLTTILDKFDPSKGSKAFSYFSVITKNWFIHKVKKNTQRHRREIQFEDLSKDAEHNHMSVSDHYDKKREQAEFWGTNERKVLEAIKILLQNSDNIEIFNKKAIYLYLRELTGLNTKQVVNNLNKMRARYQSFKKDWNEGKI